MKLSYVTFAIKLLLFLGVSLFWITGLSQAQSPGDAPHFFIKAEVDNRTPYKGQQVTYLIKRYQTVEFPNRPYYDDHPFTGFMHTSLIQRPSYIEIINQREYTVHPTHLALFPNTSGPLTLAPARLIIPGDTPLADIIVESEAIDLQIQPLPDGAPSHFNGAVGQYEIEAKFSPAEVEYNQIVNLIVTIKGTGNISTLLAPHLPEIDIWDYGMFGLGGDITDNIPLSKDVVKGSRQFSWPIYPLTAGQQFFPAIRFSYFDPQSGTYQSIRTEPIAINVIANDANDSTFVSPIAEFPQEVRRLGGDIRHIKPVPTGLSYNSYNYNVMRLSFLLGCFLVSGVTISGTALWKWWRRRQLDNTPKARWRRAKKQAIQILVTDSQLEADPYSIAKQALITYLSNKLAQPITGLNSDQLTAIFNQIYLNPELTQRIMETLDHTDTGQFAPVAQVQPTIITDTKTLINDLEQFFAKRGK